MGNGFYNSNMDSSTPIWIQQSWYKFNNTTGWNFTTMKTRWCGFNHNTDSTTTMRIRQPRYKFDRRMWAGSFLLNGEKSGIDWREGNYGSGGTSQIHFTLSSLLTTSNTLSKPTTSAKIMPPTHLKHPQCAHMSPTTDRRHIPSIDNVYCLTMTSTALLPSSNIHSQSTTCTAYSQTQCKWWWPPQTQYGHFEPNADTLNPTWTPQTQHEHLEPNTDALCLEPNADMLSRTPNELHQLQTCRVEHGRIVLNVTRGWRP